MEEKTAALGQSVHVEWDGAMRYRGGPPGGATLLVDGAGEAAPSPVASMLVALAACSAIDVVEILEKRRTPPTSVSVDVGYERADDHPRRVIAAHLRFVVEGDLGARDPVERAVELSFTRYCSVSATFAPDTELTWEVELNGEAGAVKHRSRGGGVEESISSPDAASAGGP